MSATSFQNEKTEMFWVLLRESFQSEEDLHLQAVEHARHTNKKARCHCAGPVKYRALSCRMTSSQINSDQDVLSPCGRQSARQLPFTTLNSRFQ